MEIIKKPKEEIEKVISETYDLSQLYADGKEPEGILIFSKPSMINFSTFEYAGIARELW